MTKRIEKSIEINAPAEEVWRALSEGEELKRWFPIDARVTPGEGGAVWLSWGEGMDWETPITIWKPNEQMRTGDPTSLAVDYIIEGHGGTTTLRLVQSSFGETQWDDELDTMGAGWMTFLANLKHYLELHDHEPRTLAYYRHPVVPLPRDEVYARVMRVLGFPLKPNTGERYSATTRDGARMEGVVRVSVPPINFTATVDNLDNAIVMVEIEPGKGKCRPAVWLSLYGEGGKHAEEWTRRLHSLLDDEFKVNS